CGGGPGCAGQRHRRLGRRDRRAPGGDQRDGCGAARGPGPAHLRHPGSAGQRSALTTSVAASRPASEALQRAWLERGALAWLLLPLSLLFRALVALRRALYALGLLKPQALPVPVVVVGNLIVGGAGKTPTVGALVSLLRRA